MKRVGLNPARRAFTRLTLAIRLRMEQPGRHFFAIRQADGSIEIVRRVGTISTPIGTVQQDLALAPGTFISTGGIIEERQQLRDILGEIRGVA